MLFLAFGLSTRATTYYWVGNGGLWNDSHHWALSSGGNGNAGVPGSTDNIVFDKNSFTFPNEIVNITGTAMCHDVMFTQDVYLPVISGISAASWEVYGSFNLAPNVVWQYVGSVHFKSSQSGILLNAVGKTLNNHIYFDGTGSWQLTGYLMLSKTSTLTISSGTIHANGNVIQCGTLQPSGGANKMLDLNNSVLFINNQIDSSSSSNFGSTTSHALIYYQNYSGLSNFGALNDPSQRKPPSVVTVDTVVTRPSCNCNDTAGTSGVANCCNGKIVVSVATATDGGPFSYSWSTGQTVDSVTGICASLNTINCKIYDSADGSNKTVVIPISIPQLIVPTEIPKAPKCHGQCNGWIVAEIDGGTPNYTFQWNSGTPGNGHVGRNTNFIDSALCVVGLGSTYTLTVTDAHKCQNKFPFSLLQPKAISMSITNTGVLCNGNCNGTATITSTLGGHPPGGYTYVWAPGGETTTSINGLCINTYTVTAKDDSGCTGTASVAITQPNPLVMHPSQTNVTCNGACNGTASIAPTGGTGTYTYKWTPSVSTTGSASSLCAAVYKVVVTDANGCKDSSSFTITQPAPLNPHLSQTNVDCNGNCDGKAQVAPTGGTPPYTYLWSTGATTTNVTGLCAVSQWVKVTDSNGCFDSVPFTITQPTVLILNQKKYNIKCHSVCDGAAAVHPTGGVPPYTYLWTPSGNTTDSIGSLCIGTYKIVVKDHNGCRDSVNLTLTQPTALNISMRSTNVTCHGACNGTDTATVSGGTPGYGYAWSNGKTTSAINGLCAGAYGLTVHDANGCTITASVTITQPNTLTVSVSANPNPIPCNGSCNSTLSSTVLGGTAPYQYNWAPGAQTTPALLNQCAGGYTLTVTDTNNCTGTASVTITQFSLLRDSIVTKTNVKCHGGNTGSAKVGAIGGTAPYTYNWSPSGGTNATANNLTAGTYTATVTDAKGCSSTVSVNINQPSPLSLSMFSFGDKCNGNSNGKDSVFVSGATPPYTYSWAPSGGTKSVASNLSVGCYTVTVTDHNACSATGSACITQPGPLSAIISSTKSSCSVCDGTAKVTASGGTAPYTYSWNTAPVQTSDSATGLCVGNYTVTVTDANGCSTTVQATIIPTVRIIVTTSSNTVSCFNSCDGIARANPAGGTNPYTYSWNTAPVQTNQNATGLCPGSYTVTVTDAHGCVTTTNITFVNPPQLTVTTTPTNVSCFGNCDGSATANPGGGTGAYTYSWNTAPVQTTKTAVGLCSATYTVTVTDSNGCTATATAVIGASSNISDNPILTPPSCGNSNGSIKLNPSGGNGPYTYSWSPSVTTTDSAGSLSAGTYTVTITDKFGCNKTFFELLNNSSGPTLSSSNNGTTCADTCDGSASVTITSGVGPTYSYLWNTGATTTNITALCPNSYQCSVTDNGNGCISNINVTVSPPVPINPHPTVQNVSCHGANNGKITLAPTGGTGPFTYTWSPSVSTSNSASNLSPNTYTITIEDNVLCDTTITLAITEPGTLSVSITSTNVTCNGSNNGTADAHVLGGTSPFIYSWTNGSILPNVVNLSPGGYTVTVTDVNGCSGSASVTITEPPALSDNITPTEVSCNLGTDGGAFAGVLGGTPAYTYNWSNGQTTNTLSNVSIGKYYLDITDANGCSLEDSVTLTQPAAVSISFTQQNATCNGSCNGSATAHVIGGTPNYTYSWNTLPAQTTQTAVGLCAGSYTVTVTDANNCSNNNAVTITEPPPLLPHSGSTTTSCPNSCDGTAFAAPSGGTGAYTYKWLPGNNTTSSVTNRCGGTDTLIITDANGCTDSSLMVISTPTKLSIIASTSPSNCNASDGSITVTPGGGTGAYTYTWTPPVSTTNSAAGLAAGIYVVKITDANGCDSSFNVLLNNSGGASSFTNTDKNELCFGDAIGYIVAIPNGGTLPYTYFWANIPSPSGQGTDSIYNLPAATYTLEVTDNAGCIQFDSLSITQPPQLTDGGTITNANCSGVCTGAITLHPSGGTSPYTYNWTNGATTQTISSLCPGNDTVLITDADGCTLQQIFTVGQNVIINLSTSTTPIPCNGGNSGTATAHPSGGGGIYTYSWSPGLQTTQTANNLTAGTYTVTVTDQNGCQAIDSAQVLQPAVLAINFNTTPVTCNNACDGKSVANVVGGTSPYTYHWSSGETIDSIINECGGTFIDTVTDANGCMTYDSAKFINPPVMNESHILTPASCNTTNDGGITIIASGGIPPYTFTWSNGATTQNLNNILPGKYVLTLTDSTNCVITDSITLLSDTTVLAEAGNDTTFCLNSATITLNGTRSLNATSYAWFQLPTHTLLGNTALVTVPIPPLGTTSYLLVTKDGTCVDSDTVVVTINPAPIISAGPFKSILINTNTTIGGSPTGPAGSTYLWSPAAGLGGDTTMANPVASPQVTTTYTVTVTVPSGCTATDTVTVYILPQIVIPDGFTPNGDGENDVWTIKNINLFPNAAVQIFNRWGEQLFNSTGYKTPWDGNFDNKPLPIGTYYYIIDLHDPRFPKAYTGPVTIVR